MYGALTVIESNIIRSAGILEVETVWAKNQAVGTETAAVKIARPPDAVLMYAAAMYNPSTETDIIARFFNRRVFHLTGTAQAGSDGTHIVLAATAIPINDRYNTFVITITEGLGVGQQRTISDYVGATVTAEISAAWTTIPDATSKYSIAMVVDSLVQTITFAKAVLSAPIVKAFDTTVLTGLFTGGSDVYVKFANAQTITNADAARFSSILQLFPVA